MANEKQLLLIMADQSGAAWGSGPGIGVGGEGGMLLSQASWG